jgi:hypothetical protein
MRNSYLFRGLLPSKTQKSYTSVYMLLAVVGLVFAFSLQSIAANRYSTNSGAWNSTNTWSTTNGGTPGASVPGPNDDVYIFDGSDVTIPSDYAASCRNLFYAGNNTSSPKMTFSNAGSSLTVSGDLHFYACTGKSNKTINVNGGTLSVGGNFIFNENPGSYSNSWQVNVVLTSGTINVSGDFIFDNVLGADYRQAEVFMSGGAGTFNLGGNLILNNGVGTIYSGTSSTFNYNGSVAQTVELGSKITYNNLFINSTGGATLNGAVNTTNVSGDLIIQSGRLSNGGYSIAGGSSKVFQVNDGAEFWIVNTSSMPTGFGTKNIGTASTID